MLRCRWSTYLTCVSLLIFVATGTVGCNFDQKSKTNGSNSDADVQSDTTDPVPDGSENFDAGGSDAEERDGRSNPTPDGGADAGDRDVSDASGDGGDSGPDCSIDSDSDGVNNCDERRLGTDPHDGDTDGDHLSDFEELQEGTDPTAKDSDGDGVSDKEELRFGLDPNRTDTYGDQTSDGDRWFVNACDNPSTEPVDYYDETKGNWTVALPPAFSNYTPLGLTNAGTWDASAVYDAPAQQVAGFLLSQAASGSQNKPTDVLSDVANAIRSEFGQKSINQNLNGANFTTHDRYQAAIGRYRIEPGSEISLRKMRERLLLALAPFGKTDVTGLPNSSGNPNTEYLAVVSAIKRPSSTGPDQVLLSAGVAPFDSYQKDSRVKFRMSDLTNTTNIAENVDETLSHCVMFEAKQDPKVEFYWVLDHSGSMNEDNRTVANFASQFESEVKNTSLDYRLGVTNMKKTNGGRFRDPPLWHKRSSDFNTEVRQYVINKAGGYEWGLLMAQQGLRFMKGAGSGTPKQGEKIRSGAEVVTIFMTDEKAQSIKNGTGTAAQFIQGLKGETTAFAITTDGQTCTGDRSGEDAAGYRKVALATGGKTANLCSQNLAQTIRDILFSGVSQTSPYTLSGTPISSTLRVFVDGNWVPRSRENGFDYFPENNSLGFFGSYRPGPNNTGPNDWIAVMYESFENRSKE